jgi:hypothetical protein
MNLIANAIRAAKTGAKATSKNQPFYSAADKAALALTRPKGTGKEFMTELKKTKGVKPTEIEHRKLEQIEQLPKMTKEQFLAELEKRPPADVSENVLEPKTKKMRDDIADELFPGGYDYTNYRDLRPDQRQQVDEVMATRTTAYDNYQIPAGKNYREILLQLPHFIDEERLMYLDAKRRHGGLHPVLAGEYEQLKAQKALFNPEYLSRHWEGNPNVLAHMRVSDRITPEGKKVLHVEEIQSDWHQEGREKGYREEPNTEGWTVKSIGGIHDPNYVSVYDKNGNVVWTGTNRMGTDRQIIRQVAEDQQQEKVPDAPFKKNWHELAMKRLINYAAENGYDSIAITPGAEQAKRYDLSKHINEISYGTNPDGTYSLTAIDKNGRPAINKQSMSQSELENTVGKEMAKKIVEGQGKEYPAGSASQGKKSLTGLDLQVGGEGMQGFYDKMIPDYLNQFGKPYGAQVELGGFKLKGDPSLRGDASERLGLAGQRFDEMTPEEIEAFNAKLDEANAISLHNFPITQQMREEVTQKGLPLYQQIGIPLGAGSAGTQVEVPQAPAQPEQTEEPAFAMGGGVGDTVPDMSDSSQTIQGSAFKRGGKVHIADNPDTMFMELQDRMFKRK